MYWVNRKVLQKVLRNPFNSAELIKPAKSNEIFSEIYSEYLKDYDNNWTKGSMPLNYFLKKYCETTGADKKGLETEFKQFFIENSVINNIKK